MICTLYIYIYTDVVSSQLGGLGGLCDCAVILQFHAFDWRPTTKSTKSARFSQIQPGCWDAGKALTCASVQTKGAVETEKTKNRKPKQTQKTRIRQAFEHPTSVESKSQHQGAHPILKAAQNNHIDFNNQYFDSHRFQFLHTDDIDYSYIYIPQFPSSHLVFLATVQTRPRARRRSTKGDRRWRARRHTPHRPRLHRNHSKVRPATKVVMVLQVLKMGRREVSVKTHMTSHRQKLHAETNRWKTLGLPWYMVVEQL